jgi:hypothetical protein
MAQTGRDCPIPSTHDKLNEAQHFFDQILRNYHRPWEFQFSLNAFVQAVRNITWMLQSEEHKPAGFDEWYEQQQAAMKASALLRRFVEARNIIVKRSSLTSKSSARVGLFRGRAMKLAIIRDLPPFVDTYKVLANAAADGMQLVDKEHTAIGEQIGVERTWIVDELGDGEAATHCLEALNFMGELVASAHRLVGVNDEHTEIRVDMRSVQVLLESDVDPRLIEKWGW